MCVSDSTVCLAGRRSLCHGGSVCCCSFQETRAEPQLACPYKVALMPVEVQQVCCTLLLADCLGCLAPLTTSCLKGCSERCRQSTCQACPLALFANCLPCCATQHPGRRRVEPPCQPPQAGHSRIAGSLSELAVWLQMLPALLCSIFDLSCSATPICIAMQHCEDHSHDWIQV